LLGPCQKTKDSDEQEQHGVSGSYQPHLFLSHIPS
jgi:hypothetical protein